MPRINREIQFSQARQNLSAIIDEIEKTGKAITIVRHGKPAAVVMSPLEYSHKVTGQKKWTLKGSMIAVKGVDLEKAIEEQSQAQTKAWKKNMDRLSKELAEE